MRYRTLRVYKWTWEAYEWDGSLGGNRDRLGFSLSVKRIHVDFTVLCIAV